MKKQDIISPGNRVPFNEEGCSIAESPPPKTKKEVSPMKNVGDEEKNH